MIRVAYTIFALILILIAPYWIYFPAVILGIIIFPLYLEAIALGVAVDILYGVKTSLIFAFPFGMIGALLVLAATPLRHYLRFNA